MRVVLRDDVAGTGRRGDIVDVSGGYARNFLLPKGLALIATDGVTEQAAAMRRARDRRQARDREAAQAQASLLAGAVVTISARAGSGGRLFGSVAASDIAQAVAEQKGVELDRHHVVLAEPIKDLGTVEVPVQLFENVATFLTVEVVSAG